jgi:hypothetical protein
LNSRLGEHQQSDHGFDEFLGNPYHFNANDEEPYAISLMVQSWQPDKIVPARMPACPPGSAVRTGTYSGRYRSVRAGWRVD